MIICYKSGVIWVKDGVDLTDDERKVLAAVSDAMPGRPPERVRINDVCEYEKIHDGIEGPFFGEQSFTHFVEYACKVQAPTSNELYEGETK